MPHSQSSIKIAFLFSTVLLLIVAIVSSTIVVVSATAINDHDESDLIVEDAAELGSDPTSSFCIFQLRFGGVTNDEDMEMWPLAPYSLSSLLENILTNDYPWLNATINRQFEDIIFNVTFTNQNNNNGGGNNDNDTTTTAEPTTTSTTVSTATASPNALNPIVGCRNMLNKMNSTNTPNYRKQYNVTHAWIGFQPSKVPFWMRKPVDQPEMLYISLGAVSSVLILVQGAYGIYHWYVNRGTLESVGSD